VYVWISFPEGKGVVGWDGPRAVIVLAVGVVVVEEGLYSLMERSEEPVRT